jgi:hypothetical protein
MIATSRWVLFDPNADTALTGQTNQTISGTGTQGYVEASTATSGTVSIVAGVSDQLQASINGGTFQQITLTSGTNLDARMVAREIEFKLKQLPGSEFDFVTCDYENNKFRLRSSSLGTTSAAAVDNGTNDCLHLLGMAASQGGSLTVATANGAATANNGAYTGQLTISGVYAGQFSDIYTVLIANSHPVGASVPSGTNTYAGTSESAGDWNAATAETYTVTISTANGSVMNNGAGNVPTFTVTSTQGDNVGTPVQLLYADKFYNVGTKGLRIKFSDAPFGNNDKFDITCTPIATVDGSNTAAAVGTAKYVWSSLREGNSASSTTTQVTGTAVGTKGVTVAFSNSGSLTRRDSFRIICSGPQPTTLGVTVLNFGSVTVSTYSPTKVVWFELLAGATILANTKFGLNSHGTAQHHNAGNNDTKFAFGHSGESSPGANGSEWKKGISGATDLASDVPPTYLFATEDNMPVVSTADQSIPVGVAPGTMTSDFIYLSIKLGSLETGANPSIVYRCFFDYS